MAGQDTTGGIDHRSGTPWRPDRPRRHQRGMVSSFVLGILLVVSGMGPAVTGAIDTVLPVAAFTLAGGILIVMAELYRRGIIGGDEPGRDPGRMVPRAPASDLIRLPEELAHLPLTSAAEFRQAARPMHRAVLTSNGHYLVPVGLRGAAAFGTGLLATVCIGELVAGRAAPGEPWVLLTGGVVLSALTILLVVSKHESNLRRKHQMYLNGLVRETSARVDREVEAGRIPLTPPGWQGEVPPSLA